MSAQKTTVVLDSDLWRSIRTDAIRKGVTASEIVERQLREYLKTVRDNP